MNMQEWWGVIKAADYLGMVDGHVKQQGGLSFQTLRPEIEIMEKYLQFRWPSTSFPFILWFYYLSQLVLI